MNHTKNAKAAAEKLTEFWSPRVIAELEDSYIKVAKFKDSLAWHNHAHEDELFLVLKGEFVLEMHDGNVLLQEGDLYVVPKGKMHNPVAKEECHVMLIEKKTTAHMGDAVTDQARSVEDQLRPLDY